MLKNQKLQKTKFNVFWLIEILTGFVKQKNDGGTRKERKKALKIAKLYYEKFKNCCTIFG